MDKNKNHKLKLIIGPIVVLGEQITGGNVIDSLKVLKQSTNKKYSQCFKQIIRNDGLKGIYRGYYPWGLIQSIKGIPLMYSNYICVDIYSNFISNPLYTSILAGMSSGAVQALFTTPAQRLKTLAITDLHYNKINSTDLFRKIIRTNGIAGIYKGLYPTMLRRSLDWGVRFSSIHILNQIISKDSEKTYVEKISIAFLSGIISITTPIDVIIANSQKESSKNKSIGKIVNQLIKKDGMKAFTRGYIARCASCGYHTAWVAGVGGIIFERANNYSLR